MQRDAACAVLTRPSRATGRNSTGYAQYASGLRGQGRVRLASCLYLEEDRNRTNSAEATPGGPTMQVQPHVGAGSAEVGAASMTQSKAMHA